MKLKNGKLIKVSQNANAELTLSYTGNVNPIIKINSSIEKKKSGKTMLNITYNIELLTENGDLLNKYIGEYNFEIEKDGQSVNDGRKTIFEHVQTGLIFALNIVSGNNPSFASSILPSANLHTSTEEILNALILWDFYME